MIQYPFGASGAGRYRLVGLELLGRQCPRPLLVV